MLSRHVVFCLFVYILLLHQCVCVGFALLKDPGSREMVEPEGSLNTPPDSGSPKRHFQEGVKEEQVC